MIGRVKIIYYFSRERYIDLLQNLSKFRQRNSLLGIIIREDLKTEIHI